MPGFSFYTISLMPRKWFSVENEKKLKKVLAIRTNYDYHLDVENKLNGKDGDYLMETLSCKRCGHKWASRTKKPLACPKCKSYVWEKKGATSGKGKV